MTNENRRRTAKEFLHNQYKHFRHLSLSFFGFLVLVAQTTKALSRVFTTLSCRSFEGSKSSKQVISWLSRCRRASLLAVDCVASLEKLPECSRLVTASIWLMSSMLDQRIECGKPKSEVFLDARVQNWSTKVRSPGAFARCKRKDENSWPKDFVVGISDYKELLNLSTKLLCVQKKKTPCIIPL